MPDEHGNETREEALERIRQVQATQIFGDTPTDPTIGDVVVPAHDEEGANVAAAEVAVQADEDDDGTAADLSQEEAKRQLEPLSAEEVDEGAEDRADEGDGPDETRNAADVVADIESAGSVEDVDRLASERTDAVTVQRAADKKREELSE